jgi:hypothetical protein
MERQTEARSAGPRRKEEVGMRSRVTAFMLGTLLLLGLLEAPSASPVRPGSTRRHDGVVEAVWAQWRQHSSHFTSWDHLVFSMRNESEQATARVTSKDLDEAKVERWWGDPVVVRPDQLVER